MSTANLIDSVVRSKRRTLAIEISSTGKCIIRAPHRLSMRKIEQMIAEKEAWIQEKKTQLQKSAPHTRAKRYTHGEQFWFLGEQYSLLIDYSQNKSLKLSESALVLGAGHLTNPQAAFISWYKKQARTILEHKTRELAAKHHLTLKEIKITSAQKRWGSCSAQRNINYTWRLVMAPDEIIDYVVAHELAHTVHMNHGKNFWELVEAMYKDYKKARMWLKKNAWLLDVHL
jgi:predicted metal-dependent hydrolase